MKYLLFILIFIIFSSIGFSFFNKDKINLDGYSEDIYDYSINLINGNTIDLKSYEGKKIILVNVASKCGYTPQYDGLQKLYEKYNEELEVVGVPANDFLWQEPGKNKDIQTFCKVNYGVTFPIVEKSIVKKTKGQHPLFTWLTHKDLNGWNDTAPGWNFYKYLIDENGSLISVLPSKVKPFDEEIINFIENNETD
tara:strand:+ start:106 stop:690 length:585 start_codon:yes stop_codon:yes gene_type:complete